MMRYAINLQKNIYLSEYYMFYAIQSNMHIRILSIVLNSIWKGNFIKLKVQNISLIINNKHRIIYEVQIRN